MAFTLPKQKVENNDEIIIPRGDIYEPFRGQMTEWILAVRKMKARELCAVSFDGLKLYGKYYEYAPDSTIELMFHGYKGNGERDLCGGVQRCFSLGRSALIVDQRACGKSEGKVITFGINESKDVLSWIDIIRSEFGNERKIILTGISMGASTVLTASGRELPENVVGVIADCGFTTPKAIIKKVIGEMGLPANICYPFVRLGAYLFGHFNLEETSALESVKKCKVPVFFAHGKADAFVPFDMSVENYSACNAPKFLEAVDNAGHGLCYLVAPDKYIEALKIIEKEY